MIRRLIPLAFALLMAGSSLCAQQYSFRTFGTAEGLDNLAVRRIYEDQIGFLWVSTENGIFRFDGDRFEAFAAAQGMPSNASAGFGDAPDGSLLVGGDFGLYRLAGNRFEKIPTPFKTISWNQGIQADGKGHTYLGTDQGLFELSSEPGQADFEMHRIPQPTGATGDSAYAVLVDSEGVWFGCGVELCRMDAHGTRVLGRESGLPGQPVLAIQQDHSGNLWLRTRNSGVFELPSGKAKFQRPALPVSPDNLGGVPATDSDGRILIPTPAGLLIGDDKSWQKVDHTFGLRGTVYSAFEDRGHSLWIGLAGRGLVQWRGFRQWESYSTENGLASDLVYEILPQDDGSLLVGTEAGLFRGEKRPNGMSFVITPGMSGFPVHSLARAPNRDIWVGTESRGIAHIDSRIHTPEWFGEEQGLGGKAAYRLLFDHQQRLWVATEAGLFMATPPYRKFSRIAELPSTRLWAVAESTDGKLWAGGAGGLFELTAAGWKTFTQSDGLSNQEVLSLGSGPNGTMWIGYRFGGGIDRVHPKSGGITIEKGIQRSGSNGLVYFLDFDAAGRLWAGTGRGVDIWDGSRWSHYDTNDGLAWDDCNLNAFAVQPDGTVWIGTSGGLSRFKPRPHEARDAQLGVVLTRLTIGKTDVSAMRNPSFGLQDNSLLVRYTALNAPRANGVTFRYRLGGARSTWRETAQRELQFANLAPGKYSLEIDARDSDGAWSGHSAEFPFTILAPWYATWWFTALCVLIPLSVAGGTLRLRFLGAKRRERELVLLIAEKTADLRRVNEELSKLSYTDPLTGLANRRVFDQTLDKECARVKRMNSAVSLLAIDADHFKALNDSQGHQKGDDCLAALSAELSRLCRRQVDLPARCGGEEFAIILPDTKAEFAEEFAEKVRQAIAALRLPNPASPVAPVLTVSIGVATATRGWCSTPKEIVAAADRALYAAKDAGRNRVSVARNENPADESGAPAPANWD
jgi:diguanylate cyclase (GGDEF)-like protein